MLVLLIPHEPSLPANGGLTGAWALDVPGLFCAHLESLKTEGST